MTKWPGWSNFCRCVRNDDREGKKGDSLRRETRSLLCMRQKVHRRYLNIHSELNIIGKNWFFFLSILFYQTGVAAGVFFRQRLLALTYFIITKDQLPRIFTYSDLFFIENNLFFLNAFNRKKRRKTIRDVSVILRSGYLSLCTLGEAPLRTIHIKPRTRQTSRRLSAYDTPICFVLF